MKEVKRRVNIAHLTCAAMMMALGLVLPFVTGQIPMIGSMLLAMHIPVLLAGILCGWKYGLLIGAILPFLRFFMFGMPPLFPTGIAMTFEMGIYGLVVGLCYVKFPKNIKGLYASLLTAMVAGRVVWGIVRVILTGMTSSVFTWQLFMSGAFLNAIPGIILQLVVIPAIIYVVERQRKHHSEQAMNEVKY